ncbi:putative Ion channel regulatory protein, UNC-93 [Dioscorea sansibarensis]
MDSVQHDEAAPLIVDVEDGSSLKLNFPKNHARDVHILSVAFLFIFSAYHAAQNLESTVNTEGGLGSTSMGILYVSFTLFSLVASPLVRRLGLKNSLLLGSTGYFLFIASNLIPSWYTMVPASVYFGFSASILWVGQGTYLTSTAQSHAQDHHLNEGTIIGNFNGEFWSFFASTQVIGNLLTLALLRNDKEDKVTGTGLLFTVFLICMVLGIILLFFISGRKYKAEAAAVHASLRSILESVFAPMLEIRVLSIIPLFAYSGLHQAFVWAEYTKHVVTPALGVSGVGGAMALYGAADAICSLVSGRLTSNISSVTVIVLCGAFPQVLVLLWLLFGYRVTGGVLNSVFALLIAVIWGVGNGVIITQLNALLGILSRHEKGLDLESAFGQFKVWQSAAIAVVFFLSPYISFQAMLIVMVVALCVALAGFLYLTVCVEKSIPILHDSSY